MYQLYDLSKVASFSAILTIYFHRAPDGTATTEPGSVHGKLQTIFGRLAKRWKNDQASGRLHSMRLG